MAFATKYYAQWTEKLTGVVHRVNIQVDAFAGVATRLRPTSDPLSLQYVTISKIEDTTIQPSELTFSFIVKQSAIATYDEIFTSQYREWKIIHLEDSVPVWTGYVQPDNMSRTLIRNYVEVTLPCSDALKDLKDFRYTPEVAGGFDRATIMSILKAAIAPISIDLAFWIQCDLHEESYGSAATLAWLETYVNRTRFVGDRSGVTEYDTCHDVINKLLTSWNAVLKQSRGRYVIQSKPRPDINAFVLDWTTLAQGTSEVAHTVDISSSDKFRFGGNRQKFHLLKS